MKYSTRDWRNGRIVGLVLLVAAANDPDSANRGYSSNKIAENIECEILQVVLDEARDSYKPEIVVELRSESVDDMEENIQRVSEWVERFTGGASS